MRKWLTVLAIYLAGCPLTASAHYLWLAIDHSAGPHGTMNLFFEEGPRPGDGHYLDPLVKRGQSWIRTSGSKDSQKLKMVEVKKPGKRWLSSKLPSGGPRVVESYGKFGVYRYGNTDVLLHYYAKNVDVPSLSQIGQFGRSANLKLDLVPSVSDKSLKLQLLWRGQPAAGRPVKVRGPSGFKQNLKTDDKGLVTFDVIRPGRYTVLTNVEEKKSGSDDGKSYAFIRHHSSLVFRVPKG